VRLGGTTEGHDLTVRTRTLAGAFLAASVLAYCVYIAGKSSLREYKIVRLYSPGFVLPPAHVTQVEMVKKIVPKGSTLFYYMAKGEFWQFGLWKRSLYPDYIVLPVVGLGVFNSTQVQWFRQKHAVRYALIAGTPPPGITGEIDLPNSANGSSMALAELWN